MPIWCQLDERAPDQWSYSKKVIPEKSNFSANLKEGMQFWIKKEKIISQNRCISSRGFGRDFRTKDHEKWRWGVHSISNSRPDFLFKDHQINCREGGGFSLFIRDLKLLFLFLHFPFSCSCDLEEWKIGEMMMSSFFVLFRSP